jgi:para-nitrobenzyl esterase
MKPLVLTAAVLAMSSTSLMAKSPRSAPIVSTSLGKIAGAADRGVERFLGIPYGADTGGKHRFLPPRPAPSWTGVRQATQMGNRCPQISHRAPMDIIRFSQDPVSEDCLVLNVWTKQTRAKKPVMVWIHGGGFAFGSANDVYYDGAGLARNEDVVVVSLNHRLNGFGYLDLGPEGEDNTANVGQLDIVEALRWVHDNIAAFGGDPANVTLFGQSGGGAKVATLMSMPAARGLFHKAIVESGALDEHETAESALAQRDKVLAELGIAPKDVMTLRDVPLAKLTEAFDKAGVLGFKPWIDGRTIPAQVSSSTESQVPLLIGTARDEATAFLLGNPMWLKMDEAAVRKAIVPLVGSQNVDRAIALYKERHPQDSPAQIFASIVTDSGFTRKADVMSARHFAGGAPVWRYRTDWQSPVLDGVLRAPHGVELPFVFDTVAQAPELVGAAPQPEMVSLFQRTFAAFARTGNPQVVGMPKWDRFDPEKRTTFIYDTNPSVLSDPDANIHRFWGEIARQTPPQGSN